MGDNRLNNGNEQAETEDVPSTSSVRLKFSKLSLKLK